MRLAVRGILDKGFTFIAGASIVLMTAALVIILGPMIWRGLGAVVFRGTVEFRKLQLHEKRMFGRGDQQAVEAESESTNRARQEAYRIIDRFSRGIDVNSLEAEVRHLYRELKRQLVNRVEAGQVSEQQQQHLRDEAYILRKHLEAAYGSSSNEEALENLRPILNYQHREQFRGTIGERFFQLAEEYKAVVDTVKLKDRGRYADELTEVKEILYKLFGPRPGEEPRAPLMQERYGATRWDQATKLRYRLIMKNTWRPGPTPSSPRVQVETPRRAVFDGRLDGFFDIMENDETFRAMLEPRLTFYWQYFKDDSTPGHYFGGVGPEIIGTMLISIMTMLFAVPVGVITAAYLVECAKDTVFVRFIRLCVNTLAGVPSIVFGLFGLAFFLGWMPDVWAYVGSWLQPILGVIILAVSAGIIAVVAASLFRESQGAQAFVVRITGCAGIAALGGYLGYAFLTNPITMAKDANILAGALTLSVLVLPIVIRSSEEAIRSVPRSYKEASMGLGAGGLRTFLQVTFPAALPGILTGVILSLSRAAGETAPILFTAAVAVGPVPNSIFKGGTRTLSYGAYDLAMNDRLASEVPHNQYGLTMTLILLVLILNIAAILIRSRVSRKLRGG